MTTYLIKVTLIWTLFLVLYEVLYRKSPSFTLNRVYLMLALAAGLLLPFMPLPLSGVVGEDQGFRQINAGIQNLAPATAVATTTTATEGLEWSTIVWWVYLTGAGIALLLSLREVVLIIRTAVYGAHTLVSGHRIFNNSRSHAPFSFMGWVFISNPDLYDEQGLAYILEHEASHNRRKHWLDTIIVQLFCVVFWFHPLVWRFRYLLKMIHEYEADRLAAGDNAYDYGHFLLQQALLKGTPSIAHSFHFSPIKHRIHMLTQTSKKSSWKYIMTIPALLACGLLFARSDSGNQRIRVGDRTTYKGHVFTWGPNAMDSVQIEDPRTGKVSMMVLHRDPNIVRMDGDSVYKHEAGLMTEAQFRYNDKAFHEYVIERFNQKFPSIPDSIQGIAVKNMVIDNRGKVVYYDMNCNTVTKTTGNNYDISLPSSPYAHYGKEIAKIIEESPDWLPELVNGRKVIVFQGGFSVHFKPLTISGTAVGQAIKTK